ncbi:lysophospholipid acyltransferase family protein [Chitinibacteraceae bacterium HSL-7]
MLVALLKPVAWLPLVVFHLVGGLLGLITAVCSPKWRRRLADNLRQSGVAENQQHYNRLLWSSIVAHGSSTLELLPAWLRPAQHVADWVVERDGWEHVEAALERPEPIIFVTPHLGGIEVCGVHLVMNIPREMAALYRPPRLQWLEPLMLVSRNREKGIAAPANAQGVRILLKALKRGQTVYMLPDQVPSSGDGAWAPFWGKPAYTMTLLPKLAANSRATVLFCFAERRRWWQRGYRLVVRAMEGQFGGDAAEDAALLNRNIEALVRLSPAQYLWSYNRYKCPSGVTRPDDVR